MAQFKEYDSTFTCSEGRVWNLFFDLQQVRMFCRETRLSLDGFQFHLMDLDQHLSLIYRGVIMSQDIKRYEDEIDFCAKCLNGESLDDALEALQMAILNFTLPRLTLKKRIEAVSIVDSVLKEGKSKRKKKAGGNGKK